MGKVVRTIVNRNETASSHRNKHDSQAFKSLIWSFILSLSLTAFAFIAVGAKVIQNSLSLGMFILLLAVIQAAFQLFYFMHLHEKGHRFPLLFIVSATFVALITVFGIKEMIW
jgi:cytochrome c oxidase subunit 4